MRIDSWHPRRPEGARNTSAAKASRYRRHFRHGVENPPPAPVVLDVDRLVREAMQSALAGEVRTDATFGEYASLFGFFRSAVMQEGRLLEMAIAHAVERQPHLKLLTTKPMPIVPAAQEMLKRTPSHEIKGIRFSTRVHSTETYRPDIFVVHRTKHSGLILDIKRSLGSYRPQEVDRLRFRMLAVASIASEWVAENRGPLLVEIETAIVDGADTVSDHERGVFRLSEIDALLETSGVAAFVMGVREAYSQRVQAELSRRCRELEVSQPYPTPDNPSTNPSSDASAPVKLEEHTIVPAQAPGAERRFGYARRAGLH